MNLLAFEGITLWVGVVFYVLACALSVVGLVFRGRMAGWLLPLMSLGLVAHTVSIGIRWLRIGHLPVNSQYEALSANVWGLMLALVLVYWLVPRIRLIASLLLPLIIMLLGWMLLVPEFDSGLPRTYNTVWLFIHIGFIKVFLGANLIALGIAGVILLRGVTWWRGRFERLPDDGYLDELAFRFMGLGLIFDTLGIVAGAIWAQDAWGRYWGWDPLEVWSLMTWVSIALAIHIRASLKPSYKVSALLVVGVFVVAFLTFFGVPFVSEAVHKGAI